MKMGLESAVPRVIHKGMAWCLLFTLGTAVGCAGWKPRKASDDSLFSDSATAAANGSGGPELPSTQPPQAGAGAGQTAQVGFQQPAGPSEGGPGQGEPGMQGAIPAAAAPMQAVGPHDSGSCTVHLVGVQGNVKGSVKLPLTGQPLFVQQALEQAGAFRKFKKFEVKIHRPASSNYEPHKMGVKMKANDLVDPLHDYAIYPGDQLEVQEVSNNIIQEILKSQM